MSDLLQRIQSDTQTAMRARERQRVDTLRFISATLRQAEIDQREALDDTEALRILDRLAKQYQESIETYRRAGRADLVRKESAELEQLRCYLPERLSEQALENLIQEVLRANDGHSLRDMGKIMKQLRPRLTGRADLRTVGERVKQILSSSP